MEDQKISSAIDLAVSLIRTAKFIGIDEDSQSALERFVANLDDDELSELNEKQSLSDLKILSSFFDKKAHEATHVIFELSIEISGFKYPDLSQIQVLGPTKGSNILMGEISDSDHMLSSGELVVYVVTEIDHDQCELIERYAHKMKSVNMKISVTAPYKIEVTKKTYI